jgi:D-xylose transport system substrate-binding protein
MVRRGIRLTAAASALALGLAACGGGGESGGGSAQPTGQQGGAAPEGKIGVILPDTASSVRWETADRPLLEAAFKAAGVEYDIQNAGGDKQRMATIADQMITGGVTVLAIVNLDSASGAQIERKADQQGVQTIDYDRLTLGGTSKYYVSFDNVQVGTLQGEGLQKCLGAPPKNIAFLNGSPDDNNATLFSRGAHEVLDNVQGYTKVAEQSVPDWDNQLAATIFEQMYTQQGGNINGVVAANDGLANAVISILARNNVAGQVQVTGQDATKDGLQHILAGEQCMTVYKPIQQEAKALSDLAIALAKGETPTAPDQADDPEGKRQVPAVLLDPISITKENVKQVVDDGYAKGSEICVGAAEAACTQLGISKS